MVLEVRHVEVQEAPRVEVQEDSQDPQVVVRGMLQILINKTTMFKVDLEVV